MKAEELVDVPEAAFAESLPGSRVRCKACQRGCLLGEGQLGFCGVRKNQAGKLAPLSYGRMAAVHLANVERKPLFHFFPGEIMLSLGSLGCNFRCPGCQNRELAHADVPGELSCVEFVSPESLVDQTLEQNLLGISFTYNQPAIRFEYTLDTFTCSSEAHRDAVFQGNLPRSTGHAISEAVQVLRPRFVLE